MTKTVTYAQAFTSAIATLSTMPDFDKDVLAKLEDALARETKAKAPTKVQKANEVAKPIVAEALRKVGKPITVTEFLKTVNALDGFGDYTTSKLTSILSKLREDGTVVRTMDKKVAFYSIAE